MLRYEGGEEHVVCGLDPDMWSYFEALGILKKDFKYDGELYMWWKPKKGRMDRDLRPLCDDRHALELAEYAENKNEEVEIYVEPVVSSAQVIELVEGAAVGTNEEVGAAVNVGVILEEQATGARENEEVGAPVNAGVINEEEPVAAGANEEFGVAVNVGVINEEEATAAGPNEEEATAVENGGEVNEEEANAAAAGPNEEEANASVESGDEFGVVSGDDQADELDESEEERHRDDDDYFGLEDIPRRHFSQVLNRWKKFKQEWKNRKRSRTTAIPTAEGNQSEGVGTFTTQQSTADHEIDAHYSTDELDSDVDIAYGDGGRKYPIFRGEDMCKEFKFKLGMEFSSLKQFKQALMEHSVLNGREVKFVKNDDVRVRAICKRKCGFLILCSKDGGSQTFRVKTLIDSHNCGRVFVNKNANKEWVSKIVVDKFRNVGRMTANEIIDDVRRSYSVAITPWRACRAKEIAMDILEGDGQKQYNMLYDYAAELRRVSTETTVKIKINQPQPTLQPRFGSFYLCLDGCKKGFVNDCRPFIGVDGCHLKTTYGGQLLVAVARDPNDQYFPLAFVVVENECKETWRCFLTLLLEDIGDIQSNRWVFISDQQKVNSNSCT